VTLGEDRSARPLVALISATTSAIGPAAAAFERVFPEARLWNILDDRLLTDAEDSSGVTPQLAHRMKRLIQHAVAGDADGILLTCSQYGFVSKTVDVPVPIQAPDDAAFAEVLARRFGTVLIVASLRSALADTTARLTAAATDASMPVRLDEICIADIASMPAASDYPELSRTLSALIQMRAPQPDAVLLAQYSLAPVAETLQSMTGKPVLSGPVCAARHLRADLLHPPNAARPCA
jgi:hypothetical protein